MKTGKWSIQKLIYTAMLYSCDASLSLMDVRNRILQSARPLESLSGKVATGGMLDAGAAMP